MCSRDASVRAPCWCAGISLPDVARGPRRSPDGHQLCELCLKQLSKGGPHRPHGRGRAHDTCVRRHSRAAAPLQRPIPRSKRPYDTLRPTQRRDRRKRACNSWRFSRESATAPVSYSEPLRITDWRTLSLARLLACLARQLTPSYARDTLTTDITARAFTVVSSVCSH